MINTSIYHRERKNIVWCFLQVQWSVWFATWFLFAVHFGNFLWFFLENNAWLGSQEDNERKKILISFSFQHICCHCIIPSRAVFLDNNSKIPSRHRLVLTSIKNRINQPPCPITASLSLLTWNMNFMLPHPTKDVHCGQHREKKFACVLRCSVHLALAIWHSKFQRIHL